MDILDLAGINKKFDIIECCGVLHHMKEPSKGLESLLNVLENDGLLKLGLYSEFARIDIIKAREIIKSKGIQATQDGIQLFRKSVISGELEELKKLSHWSDFYTTSMCRDLCFHIQEHRYTIEQLDRLIKSFKLDFLGFILNPKTRKIYSDKFPSDMSQVNLGNWNSFEKLYPDTFRSMYQFWVRRTI